MFGKARRVFALLAAITVLSLGGTLHPQHAAALAGQVILADTNESWNAGRFFRTGLASAQIGGVQLVPFNVLKTWNTTTALPRPLSSHTSTVYRDHVFVVGGNTVDDQDRYTKTQSFFVSRLGRSVDDQTYGRLANWTDYTATQPLPQPLSDMASVVVEVNNQAFLYVLGGQTAQGSTINHVSTNTVYVNRLVLDSNGRYIPQGWQSVPEDFERGLPLPHPVNPGSSFEVGGGALGMAAATIMLDDVPYIYIFGGYNRRFFVGTGYVSEGEGTQSAVYRTAVNDDGTLAGWTQVGDITEVLAGRPDTLVGLTGTAAVTFADPLDNRTSIYLIGGSRRSGGVAVDDAQVYVARFEDDGSLRWLPTGSMSESRAGHDAVQASGRIHVAGGTEDRSQTPSLPKASMALGLINDDLSLYTPPGGTANFELIEGALINARMNHSFETIRSNTSGDWAYVIGGQRQNTTGSLERATDQVLVGNLSEPPAAGDNFVEDAKYYSKIFDFGAGATYQRLEWSAIIGTGQKITIQYRVGDNVQSLGALSTALPSRNGFNEATIPNVKGRYFQFVATLEASPTDRQKTPILSKVALNLDRAGFPNISVVPDSVYMTDAGEPSTPATPTRIEHPVLIAPRLALTNKPYVDPDTNRQFPALDANFQGDGGFFVDLYVVPPGQRAEPPQMGEVGVAYAEVGKNALRAGGTTAITPEMWRPATCTAQPCDAVDWQRIFPRYGTYTVYIMVDSTDDSVASPMGAVRETSDDTPGTMGESDNVYGPLTLEVGEDPQQATPVPSSTPPTTPEPTTTATSGPTSTATSGPTSTATSRPTSTATATTQPTSAPSSTPTRTVEPTPDLRIRLPMVRTHRGP